MEVLFNPVEQENLKPTMEQVQLQKQEFKYLSSYLRTRGLNLYCYNPMTSELKSVEIKRSNTIHVVPVNGILVPVDYEMEKAVVDPRCYVFESLNFENAEKRVRNWKAGKIKNLCNLVIHEIIAELYGSAIQPC